MATHAHTTRRSLFSIMGAAGAAVALPATVAVAQPEPDPWDAFIAGLAVLHPGLPDKAREARAAGYQIGECYAVMAGADCVHPALLFRREFPGAPQELATFQGS